MNESFHAEPSIESQRRAIAEKIDKDLEQVEKVQALWIANVELLDQNIPHDDVQEDQKTYSYHVIRNAWLAEIDELDRIEKELQSLKEDMKTAN